MPAGYRCTPGLKMIPRCYSFRKSRVSSVGWGGGGGATRTLYWWHWLPAYNVHECSRIVHEKAFTSKSKFIFAFKIHIVSWLSILFSEVFLPKHSKLTKLQNMIILLIKKDISPLTDSHKTEQKTEKRSILKYCVFCGWSSSYESPNLLIFQLINFHERTMN